jgi:hypothetical protein
MALDLIECAFCGKAFVAADGHRPICSECENEEDALYKKARRLIRDNPDRNYSISEVARVLGVSESKITYFVDRGMFYLVRGRGIADLLALRDQKDQ